MQYTLHSEAPDTFHFWTGVGTIAGALRRKVWIDCRYWDWVPNFYIIFVAPPGIVSKSTTANIGMSLLKQVKGPKFGPDATTWQKLVEELGKSAESFSTKDGKFHKMSALTIAAGELGTFLKPQDMEMIDAMVDLWDGKRGNWRKATKSQGDDLIVNPWLNLLGCTTPAWINSAFPEYMIGGGFTSRCIFIYADQKRRLVAYPARDAISHDPRLEGTLVDDLSEIASMAGEITLSDEAFGVGEKWYHEFHNNKPPELNNEQFAGYIARKQTHIHKLAMVLSAAESNDLVIEAHQLQAAIELVTALEADMPKVFNRIGQDPVQRKAAILRSIVDHTGQIALSDLYKKCMRTMNVREFEEAVQGAVLSKEYKKVQKGNVTYLMPADPPPTEERSVESPS